LPAAVCAEHAQAHAEQRGKAEGHAEQAQAAGQALRNHLDYGPRKSSRTSGLAQPKVACQGGPSQPVCRPGQGQACRIVQFRAARHIEAEIAEIDDGDQYSKRKRQALRGKEQHAQQRPSRGSACAWYRLGTCIPVG
jgi:hypothetical protein